MVAFVAVLLAGMVGLHLILDEGWIDALYRAIVTATLTGLDTPPTGPWAMMFSAVLLFAGVAIFLFIAGEIVIAIRRHEGSLDTTSSPDAVLEEGDIIVAAGSSDELEPLEELFAPRGEVLA